MIDPLPSSDFGRRRQFSLRSLFAVVAFAALGGVYVGSYLSVRASWHLTPTGGSSMPNNLYANMTGFDEDSDFETVLYHCYLPIRYADFLLTGREAVLAPMTTKSDGVTFDHRDSP